jgi:hypothetical protein
LKNQVDLLATFTAKYHFTNRYRTIACLTTMRTSADMQDLLFIPLQRRPSRFQIYWIRRGE